MLLLSKEGPLVRPPFARNAFLQFYLLNFSADVHFIFLIV